MKNLYNILLFLLIIGCNKHNANNYSTSLHFDGKNDQLIVSNYKDLQIENGTIELWFKIDKTDYYEWHSLISKELAYQLTLREYKICAYDWKYKKLFFYGKPLNDSVWHHAALVFRNAINEGSQLFLDGKPIVNPFTYNLLNQGAELYIGSNHFTDQYFGGNIDEVRIWNKPRSSAEIGSTYNKELDGSEEGLVLYYKFNGMLAGADNRKNEIIGNDAKSELNGRLYEFQLKDSISNFVKDSPLTPKSNFNILLKIKQNSNAIIWTIVVVLVVLLAVVTRTRVLKKQNKILEQKVQDKTNELIKSLQQKETLIQEIHHRVKNNLQFIISLIDFEMNQSAENINSIDSLKNTSQRLIAIVLVHEMLYRKDNLELISSKDYLTELINHLSSLFSDSNLKIDFKLNVDDLPLTVSQSTALGILITELVTNSKKYAFKNIKKPQINISLNHNTETNEVILLLNDNGEGNIPITNKEPMGVGKKLIDVFARQLMGTYSFKNNDGYYFSLVFPLSKNNAK